MVVVSAMGKITNALEELIRLYVNKDDKKWEQLTAIKNYHTQIMEDLFDSSDPVFSEIDSMFFRIEDRLHRLPSLNFNFEYDQFIGYGELLSTKIVSAYLIKTGIKNKWIDIRFSLKTDDKWREANVDEELSAKLISQEFSFADENLSYTRLYRGNQLRPHHITETSSDYTAAILGSILKAEKVEIWKIYRAYSMPTHNTSRSVKIDEMSYREAVELTFLEPSNSPKNH